MPAALLHSALSIFLPANIFILPCGPTLPLLYMKLCTLKRPQLVVCPRSGNKPLCGEKRRVHARTFPPFQAAHHHLGHLLLVLLKNVDFDNYYEQNCCWMHAFVGRKKMRHFHAMPRPFSRYLWSFPPLPFSSCSHVPTPQLQAEEARSHPAWNALWAVMEAHISTWHKTLSLVY